MNVLDVMCPICLVEAGQPCDPLVGEPFDLSGTWHAARGEHSQRRQAERAHGRAILDPWVDEKRMYDLGGGPLETPREQARRQDEENIRSRLLRVGCPACGAAPGSACVPAPANLHGEPVTSWGVHQRRVMAQFNEVSREPLPRVAAALERIAEHFQKKDQRWEQAKAEQWDRVKDLPIEVDTEGSECVYCKTRSRRVLRGGHILGCVACFSRALGLVNC